MPDIATISSVLGSVKTATEIAKMLKDSHVSLEKAEVKLQFAELISSLADAKIEIAEIRELLQEKDQIIKRLKSETKIKGQMIWRDPVYYLQTERGKEGPFCPQCYDSTSKLIRLQTYQRDHWQCMTCDKGFFGSSYDPDLPDSENTEYEPLA
ncbi:hypothetical protein ACPV5Q_01610 [Vibrio astriarenae]